MMAVVNLYSFWSCYCLGCDNTAGLCISYSTRSCSKFMLLFIYIRRNMWKQDNAKHTLRFYFHPKYPVQAWNCVSLLDRFLIHLLHQHSRQKCLKLLPQQHHSWLVSIVICKPLVHDRLCKPRTHTPQTSHNPATNKKLQITGEEMRERKRVYGLTSRSALLFTVTHGTYSSGGLRCRVSSPYFSSSCMHINLLSWSDQFIWKMPKPLC